MLKEIVSSLWGDIKVMYKHHWKILIPIIFFLTVVGSCTSCTWHSIKSLEEENHIELEVRPKAHDDEVFTEFLGGLRF